jgi:putative ABC transport system permease protein
MIRNCFLIAIRSLSRNRLHSLINIIGLTIGLTSAILIVSYVNFEFSYDQFFRNYDRIYRVITHEQDKTEDSYSVAIYPNFHREVPPLMPEIECSTRLMNRGFLGITDLIRVGSDLFPAQKVYYGDSTFFDVFNFQLLHKSIRYPLAGKGHAIVPRSVAIRYFGREDAVGEVIRLNDQEEFSITGVMEDIPANCHFHFDVLLAMDNHYWEPQASWNGSVFATYFKLRPGSDPKLLRTKINDFLSNHEVLNSYPGDYFLMEVYLQPIEKIHLHSNYPDELEANSNIRYVLIFFLIAIFILFVAGVNYINLETARSVERAREVGLRKVFGAGKSILMWQFLGESFLTVVISFLISIGFLELVRPFFNQLIGIPFGFSSFYSGINLLSILAILISLTLLAGFYPAMVLSGFRPDQVLKGKFSKSKRGTNLRKSLVIFQFTISAALIIGSLVIYRQMQYMKNKNLGFQKNRLIVIPMNTREVSRNQHLIKSEFLKHSHILSGAAISQIPVNITFMEGISFNMDFSVDDPMLYTLEADPDIFETLGLNFIRGRRFNREYSPTSTEYILNEKGMNLLGEDILNKKIRVKHGGVTLGPVVGIVQDFNFSSLHTPIAPLVICQNPDRYQFMIFNLNTENLESTITHMRSTWNRLFPDLPFDFQFLASAYNNLYRMEAKAGNIMLAFTIIAIVIAFSGLFGLSSFEALQRTKEVGIRKVLGSGIGSLVFLFIYENFRLIMVAFLFAVPLGYYFMNKWLEGFAYRIHIGFDIIFIALGSVVFIAVISILYQAVRAAMANPVDTLRYE